MILYRAMSSAKRLMLLSWSIQLTHIINEKERSEYLSLGDSR